VRSAEDFRGKAQDTGQVKDGEGASSAGRASAVTWQPTKFMFSRTRQEMVIPHLRKLDCATGDVRKRAKIFVFRSTRGILPEFAARCGVVRPLVVRKLTELKQLSRNRDNLSDDFGIVMYRSCMGRKATQGIRTLSVHFRCANP